MYLTKNHLKLLLFLLFSLSSGYLFAQEEKSDCVLKLEQAQTKYDQGRIQDVEPLIGDCLKNNKFEKADRAQALKLLTLSYLFLEEPELAEATMLDLLKTNHEFAVNPAIDPSEFINLHEKFRNKPLLNVGILLGGVIANPIVTQLNSTQNLNDGKRQVYTPLFGIRGGVYAEYEIFDKIYVNGGLGYSSIKFNKTDESAKIISGVNNGGFEGEETQTSFELPLLLQYHIMETGILTPYISLGIAPQFLVSASHPGDAISNAIEGNAKATSSTINITKDRNRFNLNIVAVGGVKYKVGEGFINLQVRYSQEIFQSSKNLSDLNPQNPNLLWDLGNSTDGFRLHDLSIALGYTLNIYVPKKLR